MIDDHP